MPQWYVPAVRDQTEEASTHWPWSCNTILSYAAAASSSVRHGQTLAPGRGCGPGYPVSAILARPDADEAGAALRLLVFAHPRLPCSRRVPVELRLLLGGEAHLQPRAAGPIHQVQEPTAG